LFFIVYLLTWMNVNCWVSIISQRLYILEQEIICCDFPFSMFLSSIHPLICRRYLVYLKFHPMNIHTWSIRDVCMFMLVSFSLICHYSHYFYLILTLIAFHLYNVYKGNPCPMIFPHFLSCSLYLIHYLN